MFFSTSEYRKNSGKAITECTNSFAREQVVFDMRPASHKRSTSTRNTSCSMLSIFSPPRQCMFRPFVHRRKNLHYLAEFKALLHGIFLKFLRSYYLRVKNDAPAPKKVQKNTDKEKNFVGVSLFLSILLDYLTTHITEHPVTPLILKLCRDRFLQVVHRRVIPEGSHIIGAKDDRRTIALLLNGQKSMSFQAFTSFTKPNILS